MQPAQKTTPHCRHVTSGGPSTAGAGVSVMRTPRFVANEPFVAGATALPAICFVAKCWNPYRFAAWCGAGPSPVARS